MEAYKKAFEQLVAQLETMPEALDVPNAVHVALADAKDIVYASLAKPLQVRYFATVASDHGAVDVEVERLCFEYLVNVVCLVHYARHNIHDNGVNQICLTVNAVDHDLSDLDLI
jgi:hypothetical protein